MKKVGIGFLLVGAVFFAWYGFTGMYADRAGADPEISAEAIKEQIAGQYSGEIQEMKFSEKDGNYHAVIKADSGPFQLVADGDTGRIVRLQQIQSEDPVELMEKKKMKADLANQKEETATTDQDRESPTDKQEEESNEKSSVKQQELTKQPILSYGEATDIALAEFNGVVDEVELDEDDGKLRYEIEIENGDMEAEVVIDAYTGKVVIIEIDDE